ncbi:YusW family protein [Virgibacillus sp. YIM 98842]|uniref:YusW family protein n=1 Tax=Virgibacillus sp. YIM 98842 TaxID=2663533 RepID=UPI0013D9E2C4|nr:YusW family protein [Virgibacillus sp. YIM 98842]
MKKTFFRLGAVIILTLLLAACGNNDEVENPPDDGTGDSEQQTGNTNDTNNDTGTDADTNTEYGFFSFDLEADYTENDDDALDVDFENEPNDEMEASYRDREQGIDLIGDEAMEQLDIIFSSFHFDEKTPDEEVLNAVIEGFNIPEDAIEIELEIEFDSGTEKEYQQ